MEIEKAVRGRRAWSRPRAALSPRHTARSRCDRSASGASGRVSRRARSCPLTSVGTLCGLMHTISLSMPTYTHGLSERFAPGFRLPAVPSHVRYDAVRELSGTLREEVKGLEQNPH